MRCEGSCNRSFRQGERVYAVQTRIIIIRKEREQITDVEAYYCAMCYADSCRPSLFAVGVARVS